MWSLRSIMAFCVVTFLLPVFEISFVGPSSVGGCTAAETCWQQGVLSQLPLPLGVAWGVWGWGFSSRGLPLAGETRRVSSSGQVGPGGPRPQGQLRRSSLRWRLPELDL